MVQVAKKRCLKKPAPKNLACRQVAYNIPLGLLLDSQDSRPSD
jgi:hypothetical protein